MNIANKLPGFMWVVGFVLALNYDNGWIILLGLVLLPITVLVELLMERLRQ